jgi:hypothetical protein
LAHEVLGRTLDEMPPQTRRFLLSLDEMVRKASQGQTRSEVRFTARQAREHTGWGSTQVKIHLARLVDEEYILIHRGSRGQSYVYELLWSGEGQDGTPFLMRLLDVDDLRATPRTSFDPDRSAEKPGWSESEAGWSEQEPNRSGSGRPVVGGWSGSGRPPANLEKVNQEKATLQRLAKSDENSRSGRTPRSRPASRTDGRESAPASLPPTTHNPQPATVSSPGPFFAAAPAFAGNRERPTGNGRKGNGGRE